MPPANDPDKELKACLDGLPHPRWKRIEQLMNPTDGTAPAKPTYLNFNALGAKMKTWSMNFGDVDHCLKMGGIFKTFGQDCAPFIHFEGLGTTMRQLVAGDNLEELKGIVALHKDKGQNPRELPPGAHWALLSFASYLGRHQIVKYLLGKDGCFPVKLIDEVDQQGCTALIWAAASGSVETVKVLLDHNADLNTMWNEKESPLMIAACRGHAKVVRCLIDRDADVNMVDANADRHGPGWGPVQKACWWGHDEVLAELLLEHKHNPGMDKTLRASAKLQGHDHIIELLDGRRGPRSFPRVSVKLFLGGAGNEADLRREVRTVLSNSLQSHDVQFSDVAVPEIEAVDAPKKGKIAHCEIRIRSSTVVGIWRDLKKHISDKDSPIRKSAKLGSDPENSVCTISWPMSKMTDKLAAKMAEEIKKNEDPALEVRGKKNPLADLDLKNAPGEILQTAVVSIDESVQLYAGITKELETSESDAMIKLRAIASQGRFFVEEMQAAEEAIQAAIAGKLKGEGALGEKLRPLAKRNTKLDEVLKKYDWNGTDFDKPPKLDALLKALQADRDAKDDAEDDQEEKAETFLRMISTLMPRAEAHKKELGEDVCEHFQTTDDQKRYEAGFRKGTEKNEHQDAAKPDFTSKVTAEPAVRRRVSLSESFIHFCPQEPAPAAVLLAPQFTPRAKQAKKEEVKEEATKEAASASKGVPEVRKAAQLAQKKLKGLLVPKTEWAAADLNDTNAIPHGDPQREIRDQGLVLGGCCTDPGIKSAARIREKANEQNPEAPDYTRITDISRLGANFETVDALFTCIQSVCKVAEICWIDNKFRAPSALGYSDVSIGIRITMPGEKSHICELQLSVDKMFAAKKGPGQAHYEKMRSSLADLHIPAHMQDSLLRFIISMLDEVEGDG
jgi:hypothetical protein